MTCQWHTVTCDAFWVLRPGTTQSILNGNGSSATNPAQDLYIICTRGMLSRFHVANGFNLIQMVALVGWQHMFHDLIPVKDFDAYGLSHILSDSTWFQSPQSSKKRPIQLDLDVKDHPSVIDQKVVLDFIRGDLFTANPGSESLKVLLHIHRASVTASYQGYPRIVSGSVNHLGLQVSSLLQDCHSSAFFLCRSTLSLDSWHSQRCEQKMIRTKESRFCSWKHWNNWMNMIENDQSTLCHWLCPSLIVCQTDADIWITGCFAKQMEIVAIEPAAFNDLTPILSIKGSKTWRSQKIIMIWII